MRPDAVLAVADVRVSYGGADVLDVAALEVRAHEVLGVIGPNGSGKSTLLRVLGLLEAPARGEVRWRGRAVRAADALEARRRMATVFQEPLLADMTVAANVALGLAFHGVGGDERQARVARWLARLNVAPLRDRRARTLSGGQAQRVALARALVLEPEVLLLDEPFAGLDQPAREALIPDLAAILREHRVTTVLVTHDRGEAQALADRVAVLIGGRVRQLDATADVFHAPASEEVARFVGVETIVSGRVVAREAGVTLVDVAGRRLELAAEVPAGARVRLGIRPEDVTLARPGDAAPASSARNRFAGAVARVTPSSPSVRVLVDCGFPLVAAVTPRSVADLGLAPGAPVVATFKASAVHLIAADVWLDTVARPGV
ncbi:MAG: ABC transporter ATP-binding protein [Candidatus Rokubacteria bacterium]|nr:ABC transporter ATP-binding protein [Candidatus Rokubacteria bacterium]